jgi:hypothetical protein
MTSLPKHHIIVTLCLLQFISSGVASPQTNISFIIIISCSSMKSRVSLGVAFCPLPHKNGGLLWETLIGKHSGPNQMQISHWHSTLTFSGSMEALSFLVMSKVPTMLQGITTLPLDCLVIATFIWTWWTTLISAKSSYTTAIPSTCLRKSRRWNASCSQLILRSDGKISVHKSRQLWRCGIHWVVASIPNSSAIRSCGENLFEQCTKL